MNTTAVYNELYISNQLTQCVIFRDNIPTVKLGAWPMIATMFDGEAAAGPLPTLFSGDPGATLEAIERDPIRAHTDLQRLSKMFFAAEYINIKDCPAVLKKTR